MAEKKALEVILSLIDKEGITSTRQTAKACKEDHDSFFGKLKALESREMIKIDESSRENVVNLTKDGKEVINSGSPEFKLYSLCASDSEQLSTLQTKFKAKYNAQQFGAAFSNCKKNGWIQMAKDKSITKAESATDTLVDTLKKIQQRETQKPALVNELKKRKLVTVSVEKDFTVSKGPEFSTTYTILETELSIAMLQDDKWEKAKWKPLNFKSKGVMPRAGCLHPLLKVRNQMRKIFLEMGFSEMPTNRWVESSFWNFDALFQPQQHPARDAHDTFFLKTPAQSKITEPEYAQRVKDAHETGKDCNSTGWGNDWSMDEAKRNILRTHTTGISSQMLYNLVKGKEFKPVKYFSIDRVFRNETLDSTHLAEFNQVEGLIADYNLTLGDLMGVIEQFFAKLGLHNLTFKPAYNPYTEPSMEVFAWYEPKQCFLELGNSGIFRPEMLLPMGLPPDVNVIAWGLSLERPTMIKYGIDNIRELVGHKVQIDYIHQDPICRIDK